MIKVDKIKQNKIFRFVTNRKFIVIAIAILTAIAMIITGIVLVHTALGFIPADEISEAGETHNNLIRLEIYKLGFFLLIIVSAGVVLILITLRIGLEYIFLAAALGLGLVYMFSITPFSAGDEPHHYQSAYIISGYMLFDENPFKIDSSLLDYDRLAGHQNVPSAYLRFMEQGIYINRGEVEMIDIHMQDTYTLDYPFFYLPQALGISIARIIGLSFFGVFYLGRLFNLLFFILCVFLSIKRLEAFKLPVLLLGLLPMCLHQAASFSNDTFVFGISILFFAYAVSCMYEKNSFRWGDYIMLLVTSMLLAPAKVVYFPVILLVFLIAWRWKTEIKWKAWLLAGSIVAASAAMIVVFMGSSTAGLAGESPVNWEGGNNFTLSFIIENPLKTAEMYLRSMYHWRDFYFYSMFGQFLSGLTLVLPKWYIQVTIILLIAGITYGKRGEWQPSIWDRAFFFMICAAVVILNFTAMMLGWTSDWHTLVLGIQGRYFIPILPLALLMLKNRFTLVSKQIYHDSLITGYMLMQSVIVAYILTYTVGLYVII